MLDREGGQEKRKSDRKDVAYTFTYSIEEPYALRVNLGVADDISALMLDLSDLGVAILTEHDLPAGTKLLLKFNLMNLNLTGEDRRRNIKVSGEVTSCIALSKTSFRAGIRFDRISDEDKNAIRVFVKSGFLK
jgi:hypothetical protein